MHWFRGEAVLPLTPAPNEGLYCGYLRQFSRLTIHPYIEVYDLNLLVCTRYKNSSINAPAFLSKILLAELPVKLCSGLMLDKNG